MNWNLYSCDSDVCPSHLHLCRGITHEGERNVSLLRLTQLYWLWFILFCFVLFLEQDPLLLGVLHI